MSFQGAHNFAGDLTVEDSFSLLRSEPRATLVDVRTEAEWQFVGAPDLSSLGKSPVFLQWQTYPAMAVAENFVETLAAQLRGRGLDETAPGRIFVPFRRAFAPCGDRDGARGLDSLLQHRGRI